MAGYIVQQILNGLALAAVYVLLAVAFALVHAVTRRIVFTLGDLATYASFCALYVALLALVFDFRDYTQILLAFAAAGPQPWRWPLSSTVPWWSRLSASRAKR